VVTCLRFEPCTSEYKSSLLLLHHSCNNGTEFVDLPQKSNKLKFIHLLDLKL